MRIDSSLYSDLSIEIGQANRSNRTSKNKADISITVPDGDTAAFSNLDDTVHILESEIKNLPDVRQERISALRSAIERNQYCVSPDKIADAIYREIVSLLRTSHPE